MEKVIDQFYITTDAVVFTVDKDKLKVLLIKRKNPPFQSMFALPGGFLRMDDKTLDDCAYRELYEETGVKDIFLKKLTAFGDIGRDPRGRVITVSYLALINSEKVEIVPATDALEAGWFPIDNIPKLGFDHKDILMHALNELIEDMHNTNIAFQLLPDMFTLTEMQKIYEAVYGTLLDKRNFRKKINSLDILKDERQAKMEGAHRPAKLYSFKNKKYQILK